MRVDRVFDVTHGVQVDGRVVLLVHEVRGAKGGKGSWGFVVRRSCWCLHSLQQHDIRHMYTCHSRRVLTAWL